MRRTRLTLLLAVAVAAVPTAVAVGTPSPTPRCEGPLACVEDTAAVDLERRIDDHLHYGQLLEIDYATPERVPGQVVSGGAWGDSALWTGVYLAGESMRYAVATDKLGGKGKGKALGRVALTDEERAEWTAQRDEALSRVRLMADKFHLLTRIGRDWQTELSPNTSYDPTSPAGGPPSFGGGIPAFQGEEGMLMRGCAPAPTADKPIGIAPNANKRVFGPFTWDGEGLTGRVPAGEYYCETAPSRDSYAGTLYGLLHAYDLVGKDDPALREQIRGDVLLLATRLVKFGWSFPRPHGNISTPVDTRIVPLVGNNGHDFDNFISPTFMQQVPSARLNVAQSARHVAEEGTAEQRAIWSAVWQEELATQLPVYAFAMEVDALQPNEGYYKYNLNHLTLSNTIRLERDPLVRTEMLRGLAAMDATTGDDGNAHFQSIVYGRTGEPARLASAVQHLGEWLDYRATTHSAAGRVVRNSPSCTQNGGTLECVPQGQLDVDTDAGTVTAPDPNELGSATGLTGASKLRARNPLPVAVRTPTDFLWQRPPTQLDGEEGPTHAAPGVDYLTPYWTIRYYTEVAQPDLAPLPAWAGPSHR
jgi:hypothetical protein